MSKNKSVLIALILLTGFFIFMPPRAGQAQKDSLISKSPEPNIEAREKQAIRNATVTSTKLAENLQELKATQKPRPRPRYKKVNPSSDTPRRDIGVAIRFNKDIYEVEPEIYHGYVIIDLDSLLPALALQSIIVDPDVRTDTIPDEVSKYADQRISFWQRIKNLFKRGK